MVDDVNKVNEPISSSVPALGVTKLEPVTPVKESIVVVSTQELVNRDAIVLKTVRENLAKVAASFVVQVKKEGADPEMVKLLETAQTQLEAIKSRS